MTIKTLKSDCIEQFCENCDAIREVKFNDLTLGILVEGVVMPNIIALPPCDQCPSIEYLYPSDDRPLAADISKSEHRIFVDTLKEELMKAGRVVMRGPDSS